MCIKQLEGDEEMKTIRAIAILAVFLFILTCMSGMVSAGVEPSPFKSKTVENKIQVARYQMVIMGCTLGRFERKLTDLDDRGTLVAAVNQINILHSVARSTLRTLESAKAMYEQRRDDDYYDFSESLEEFREYCEALKDDIILGLEPNPLLPKAAKMALRQLAGILQDIENEIDGFLTGNVDN
jgi:hypothetical protein